MEILFGLAILIACIIMFAKWVESAFVGKEIWCNECNRWYKMRALGSSFSCPECGEEIPKDLNGCPQCLWYGRYENRFLENFGPIFEGDMFQSWEYYREWWSCPKHGKYERRVPASAYMPLPRYLRDKIGYQYYRDSQSDPDDDYIPWGPV